MLKPKDMCKIIRSTMTLYHHKNVGAGFVVMGSILLVLIAGELAVKLVFIFLALMCIDYGLRLMGNESLVQMIKRLLNS